MESSNTKRINTQKEAKAEKTFSKNCNDHSDEIKDFISKENERTLIIPSSVLGKIMKEISEYESITSMSAKKDSTNCYLIASFITKIIRTYEGNEKTLYSCNKIYAIPADGEIRFENYGAWQNHVAILVKEKAQVKGEESILYWVIDPIVGSGKLLRIDEWMQALYKIQKKQRSSSDELTLSFIVFPPYFMKPMHYLHCFIFNEENFAPDVFFDKNIEEKPKEYEAYLEKFINKYPLLQAVE